MNDAPAGTVPATPSLLRRMACFLYEGVLLFGVLMIAGYLFSSLTQQRNAMVGRHGLEAFLFLVLGIYFGWFWSRGGQTVAMKAWHVRLVDRGGGGVSQARALARYVLAYAWFLPGLAVPWLLASRSVGAIFGWLAGWIALYALSALALPGRQFPHDLLAGTRLVLAPPRPKAARRTVEGTIAG